MIFDFCDQHVIVTGATRGIGKAISMAFLQKGARVIGVYGGNNQAADELREEVRSLSGSLSLFQCDVSKESEVRQLFGDIERKFNSLDILVNNAGIRRDSVLALMDADDWQRVLDVNLTGSFLMAKEAVLMMMQKKYGRIINITSPVSHLGFAGQANYAASKAGQVAMTKSLAKETARKKITVNCVSPGFIAHGFYRRSHQGTAYRVQKNGAHAALRHSRRSGRYCSFSVFQSRILHNRSGYRC